MGQLTLFDSYIKYSDGNTREAIKAYLEQKGISPTDNPLYVYRLTFLTGEIYIGITKVLMRRFRGHLCGKTKLAEKWKDTPIHRLWWQDVEVKNRCLAPRLNKVCSYAS